MQSRVSANGRVGATAAVYTAAILGKTLVVSEDIHAQKSYDLALLRVPDCRGAGACRKRLQGSEG